MIAITSLSGTLFTKITAVPFFSGPFFFQTIFGTIEKPAPIQALDTSSGGQIGLLLFFSNLFQLLTVIAGLWVLLNIVLAGFEYISSQGDSGAHAKVREKVTNSVLGIVLIVSAYTIVAIIGLLFFGEANYFLQPTLITPTTP